MWTFVIFKRDGDDKLVTTESGDLVNSKLQLVYDLSYQFLEENNLLPTKPGDVDPTEWQEKGFKEALSLVLEKAPSPSKKFCGVVSIALPDPLANDFINHLKVPGWLVKNTSNRQNRRFAAKLRRSNHDQ